MNPHSDRTDPDDHQQNYQQSGQHEQPGHRPDHPHMQFGPQHAIPEHFGNPPQPAYPVRQNSPTLSGDGIKPVAVVKVLSPVGVEYVFMAFTLFVTASALIAVLLSIINSGTGFVDLAFPTSTLVVSLPVFSVLFLHLKRLESRTPDLRFDPSKRRSTQVIQIISFLVSLFTLIGFVYDVIASLGGQSSVGIGKAALDAVTILVVAGGILFYYWRDEHKVQR